MGLLQALLFISILTYTSALEKQTYIVRVANDQKPSAFTDDEHWYQSTVRSLSSNIQHQTEDTEDSVRTERTLLHTYRTVFHGFASELTPDQVQELKARPEILGIYPNQIRQIQTTRSPQFLGLTTEENTEGIVEESDYGSNIIIGVLDTGIWPERESFNDNGLGPIPSHWKGECMEGENFTKSLCNKKIVGARYYYDSHTKKPEGYLSARDSEGHGTHTASTAAGRAVGSASLLGFAKGTATGIAPKARLAIYKVCWSSGCYDADILAGFDKAVEDGVNVISFSIGSGPLPFWVETVSIATFGAMEHGVLVSAAAGNSGPEPSSITNTAPWITTVGAGTIDRTFPADLVLGDGTVITGSSLYKGDPLPEKSFQALVYGGNVSLQRNGTVHSDSFMSALCMPNSLDPELVRGKIVICDRGIISRVSKGLVVKNASGVGMVLANTPAEGEGLIADAHLLPAVAISDSAAKTVHRYLATAKDAGATILFRGTQLNVKPAPLVAGFSSRGPSRASPYVMKPDLIAPGVNMLAAWPEHQSPTELSSDTRRTEFNILSGTSMSCPHVSGIVALLKGAHFDWSPARIRSAMMTTAYVHDTDGKPMLDEADKNVSNMWDHGSGHVDPVKALDPGLVFDLMADDYIDFLCASNYSESDIKQIARRQVNCTKTGMNPWDLNYPSVAVSFEQSGAPTYEVTVTRTVTHVSEGASRYTVKIENPDGTLVSVDPPTLEFSKKDDKLSYKVKITSEKVDVDVGQTKSVFGRMIWTDGKHVVGIPIAVTFSRKRI